MPGHDIIVIGASAGGVEALTRLVAGLPRDLPASLFVVLHVPAHGTSVLPAILSRRSPLRALHPRDGDAIEPGCIYVAPPDHHLLVKPGHVRLTRGPRENSARPAVDPLFRTAAVAYGARVVGVVLSGNLDDGTAGLLAVKLRGGVAVAQDPEEALYRGMPSSAVENVPVDHVLPLAEIGPLLERLAHTEVEQRGEAPVPDEMDKEADIAEMEADALLGDDRPGTPSGFSCPECRGVLWELREGDLVRYRCRVGHAYSVETLLAEQSDAMEVALWAAFTALEERAAFGRKLAQRMEARGHALTAERYRTEAEETERRAALVREVLLRGGERVETRAEAGSG